MSISDVAEPKAKLKNKSEIMGNSLFENENGNFAKPLLPAGRFISRNLN